MKLQTTEAQEFRFQQIVTLDKKGYSQTRIAEVLKCSQSWVSKFLKRYEIVGDDALQAKRAGNPRVAALSEENLQELAKIIETESPTEYGFETDGWTRPKVAEVIYQRFGVRHDVSHISRLMKKIGFSLQKPLTKDYRQSADELSKWRKETLPSLKKSNK